MVRNLACSVRSNTNLCSASVTAVLYTEYRIISDHTITALEVYEHILQRMIGTIESQH